MNDCQKKQGEGSGLVHASSSDSGSQDAAGAVGGVGAEDAEGAEDAPPDRAQGQRKKQTFLENKRNQFEGDPPHFLGE